MEPSEKQHIRPRVRSRIKNETSASTSTDIDRLMEETQRRLDTLLHSSADVGPTQTISALPSSKVQPQRLDVVEERVSKPTGILKIPKYSIPSMSTTSSTKQGEEARSKGNVFPSESQSEIVEGSISDPAVKIMVMERDPAEFQRHKTTQTNALDPRAVEGYVPKSDIKEKHIGTKNSSSNVKTDLRVLKKEAAPLAIEADLEFSVLSQQEYNDLTADDIEEQFEQPVDAFRGTFDIFSKDGDENDNCDFDSDPVFSGFNGDDEEDLWSDQDVEETIPREPRSFIKLWEAISGWATPEAVALLNEWQEEDVMEVSSNWVPVVDTSDIAASRCAGVMALLNMHLPRCWKELGYCSDIDIDRIAKHRLADLLRTFSYSRSTPRLDTDLWRAMTNVLLCIVLSKNGNNNTELPPSINAVGLTIDEYIYLTRKCFKSLDAGFYGSL